MNVSELKKLETTGYSSKLDEIAKNDTEVFLKVKLSGRRTFGEDEFEPKNGFAVDFGNHMNVLDLDKCDVYQLDQPQLNEYQQIAINNAKKSFEKGADLYDCSIDMMLYDGLTDKEWAKVTVAFLLWALEQEEG